jgi:hypothetical protein
MEDGKTRKPRDMRRDLIAGGMDLKRVSSMTGNFYNAISRLTQDGILIRSGAKYSRANGNQSRVGGRAVGLCGKSVDFTGYWQRHIAD